MMKILEDFFSNVEKEESCWSWTGSINSSGYGSFQDGSSKGIGAHRWAYEWFVGEPGDVIRHSCRNRHCVNPSHLLAGTQIQNMQDKFFDGTGNTQRLTPADVREIRARFVRYNQRRSNAHELAAEFGVTHKWIQKIAEAGALSYVR